MKVAHLLQFDPGTIVVDDRGYNDYGLFGKWTAQGIYFVTRIKDNALYKVIEEWEIPQNRHIIKDEVIRLTGLKVEDKCPYPSRRIEVYDPEKEEILIFLTNHLKLGATTIAAIYKDRCRLKCFSRPSSKT